MLSKTTEYALRALTLLATPPARAMSCDLLASRTKVPRSYLHRVLQELVAAGLVRSRPGPRGGYELACPAAQVSILDVVNATGPIERILHCPLDLPSHTELCPLHRALDDAYAQVEEAFRKVTLQQLVGSADPIVPLCDVRRG